VRQKDVSFFSIEQLQLHTLRRTMRTHCVLRTISLKCRIEVYVYSTNPSEIKFIYKQRAMMMLHHRRPEDLRRPSHEIGGYAVSPDVTMGHESTANFSSSRDIRS
jgi:hypothetical protein